MGRLWFAICALLLSSSVALAGYSTNRKDLERAAELAVERAAEKAAERAVEKALNSGNSSTITVTVKEAYEHTKKTAEEAAAPGSESTRPYDPKIHDRQYAYAPPPDGEYKVSDSAEAEQLGVSQESLNSSVEDLGSGENLEGSAEGGGAEEEDVDEPVNLTSFESTREGSADREGSDKEFDGDLSLGLDFGLDFGSLDMSSGGDFGSKSSSSSNTETYTSSYSKPNEAGGSPVEVNEAEDREIFGMYAANNEGTGWSSSKQEGWVRHRPLWDDSKSRVSRESKKERDSFWLDFGIDVDGDGAAVDRARKREVIMSTADKPKRRRLFKRTAAGGDHETGANQVAVPLASLSLDPKAPALLYQLLQKELKYSGGNFSKSPISMRLYVTVPVPLLRASNNAGEEVTHITPKPVYHATVAAKRINEEMDDQGTAATKHPSKRSSDFGGSIHRTFSSRSNNVEKNYRLPKTRRSLVKVTKHKLEFKDSTTKPVFEIPRIKPKS